MAPCDPDPSPLRGLASEGGLVTRNTLIGEECGVDGPLRIVFFLGFPAFWLAPLCPYTPTISYTEEESRNRRASHSVKVLVMSRLCRVPRVCSLRITPQSSILLTTIYPDYFSAIAGTYYEKVHVITLSPGWGWCPRVATLVWHQTHPADTELTQW